MAFPRWDRLEFYPYVRVLADRLSLRDWTILVKDEAPDDGTALAAAYLPYGRKRVQIYLSEDFLKADEAAQRQTVVHELLHCHFDVLERMVVDTPDMKKAARLCLELAVDSLADAIAPLLPLPSAILDPVELKPIPKEIS